MKLSFLTPRQPIFFKLLNDLGEDVSKISLLFKEFVDSSENFRKAEEYAKKATEIEHQADELTREITDKLNRTFVTPLDREDIFSLTQELDDIVDEIENVVKNISIYKIQEREQFIVDFSLVFMVSADCIIKVIQSLNKQNYRPEIRDLIHKVHESEDEGDRIFLKTLGYLFEKKDPVSIIIWKDILEDLEKISDKFQDASVTIEGVFVKSQ
jgi:hypothetical protein